MELGYDNININGGVRTKRSEPLRPLHTKKLDYQALMKRIPQEMLESFILEKSNNINNLQKQDVSECALVSQSQKMWCIELGK